MAAAGALSSIAKIRSMQPSQVPVHQKDMKSLKRRRLVRPTVINTLEGPMHAATPIQTPLYSEPTIKDIQGVEHETAVTGINLSPALSINIKTFQTAKSPLMHSALKLHVAPNNMFLYVTQANAYIPGSLMNLASLLILGVYKQEEITTLEFAHSLVWIKHFSEWFDRFRLFTKSFNEKVTTEPEGLIRFKSLLENPIYKREPIPPTDMYKKPTVTYRDPSQVSIVYAPRARPITPDLAGFKPDLAPPSSASNVAAIASEDEPVVAASPRTQRLRLRKKYINYTEDATEVPDWEVPAPFDPPLLHDFSGMKLMVTAADFKTLYNNNWINDVIIDFFINYEIEQAHRTDEVYAFNSFFNSKLKANSTDPYKNVERWVSKANLANYSAIVIPINENLHWYGCMIVGLSEYISQRTLDPNIKTHTFLDSEDPDIRRLHGTINIFVFDSLVRNRNTDKKPIANFLTSYCKHKHNIIVDKSDIIVRRTFVPKQSNFNDCGLHVIYNIRKFLKEPQECLKAWKKRNSRFFDNKERQMMRELSIECLLKLHSWQYKKELFLDRLNEIQITQTSPSSSSTSDHADADDGNDDDVIEVGFKEIPVLAPHISVPDKTKENLMVTQQLIDSIEAKTPSVLNPDRRFFQLFLLGQDYPFIDELPHEAKLVVEYLFLQGTPQALVNPSLIEKKSISQGISPTVSIVLNYIFKTDKVNENHIPSIIKFKKETNELDIMHAPSENLLVSNRVKFLQEYWTLYKNMRTNESQRPRNEAFHIAHKPVPVPGDTVAGDTVKEEATAPRVENMSRKEDTVGEVAPART